MTYADDLDTPSGGETFDAEGELDAEYEPVDNYSEDEYDFDDDEEDDDEDDEDEDDDDEEYEEEEEDDDEE